LRRPDVLIKKIDTKDFDMIFDLMEKSFPPEEYRTYNGQKALLDDPAYTIYALYSDTENITAFIAVWEFDDFAFIEHFAVAPEHRNKGVGTYIMNGVIDMLGKMACLEVEPPDTEICKRRIAFYERNNFYLNDYPYIQPRLREDMEPVPLYIMTSGGRVDECTFDRIREALYTKVYKCV